MNKTLYVGIDVSKDKLDTAITEDGRQITVNSTFNNTFAGFKKLIAWCKKHSKKLPEIHFCLEVK